jgi:hypothetical protein
MIPANSMSKNLSSSRTVLIFSLVEGISGSVENDICNAGKRGRCHKSLAVFKSALHLVSKYVQLPLMTLRVAISRGGTLFGFSVY